MIRPTHTGPGVSLLDKLLRDGGDSGRRANRHQQARSVRESVRRDLENLLNTRWRCVAWPPHLTELEQSLVNYGIPDFTSAAFNDPGSQRDLQRVLAAAIRRFEPRFRTVKLTLLDGGGRRDRTLRFRIDAVLRTEAADESVTFETRLDPSTSNFSVGRVGS